MSSTMPEVEVTSPAYSPSHILPASFEERIRTPLFQRRSFGGSCGSSSAASPETDEFESLERRLNNELQQKLHERRESEYKKLSAEFAADRKCSPDPADRKVSHDPTAERKNSDAGDCNGDEELSLQLVEKRQLRSFSRADEYLYAMKEDLAEWFNLLYPWIDMAAETFMDKLQTGEHLLRHANAVRRKHVEILEKIARGEYSRKPPGFSVPQVDLPIRENVTPGTWFARDNVYNFIKFCRDLQVMEVIMFETEDLVSQKNEKHVVLTLLEVARRGAKLGMIAPMLVQFEQQIDIELAREEKERKRKEKEEREKEKLAREEEKLKKKREKEEKEQREKEEKERREREEKERTERDECDLFPSLAVEVHGDTGMDDLEDDLRNNQYEDDFEEIEEEEEDEEEEEEEEEEDEEGYPYPIGPHPQEIFNDLRSLDEMVRDLVSECQCPIQFPVIRVSEGKYRIGDTKVLIFVRILRSHVMVRVGGGWDTLQNYLDKHDPCRCRRGHRSTTGAHLSMRSGKSPMAAGVTYDRCESPGTPRRRSSAFNGSRQGSFVTSSEKPRSHSRQWDSPRGSLQWDNHRGSISSMGARDVHRGSVGHAPNPRSRSPSSPNTNLGRGSTGSCSGSTKPIFSEREMSKMSKGVSPLARDSETRLRFDLDQDYKDGRGGYSARSDSSCSSNLETNKDTRQRDPLLICDSSSEVSDEGYKSSQGNISKLEGGRTLPSGTSIHNQIEGRPESSLTVASDCSSTISTEDEDTATRAQSPPPEPVRLAAVVVGSPIKPAADPVPAISELKSPGGTTLSPATKNRLANLFKRIPKFTKSRSKDDPEAETSQSSKTSDAKPRSKPAPAEAAPQLQRTRSVSSDAGFSRAGSERGSYRAPKGTSRYMQAAEAYKYKTVGTSLNTWSASSSRARTRPSLSSDTFSTPPRTVRTASASPAVHRKRMNSASKDASPTGPLGTGGYQVTSTHSTPSRRPVQRSQSRDYTDIETDEMILRRMEEILFTYKSKVEDRLAAEGKELPKDIFQDFTEHWINSSPYRAKSVDSLDSSEKSVSAERTPILPKTRKDTKEGYSSTKIPMPTFYKNSLS